jgi:hypothetical protein
MWPRAASFRADEEARPGRRLADVRLLGVLGRSRRGRRFAAKPRSPPHGTLTPNSASCAANRLPEGVNPQSRRDCEGFGQVAGGAMARPSRVEAEFVVPASPQLRLLGTVVASTGSGGALRHGRAGTDHSSTIAGIDPASSVNARNGLTAQHSRGCVTPTGPPQPRQYAKKKPPNRLNPEGLDQGGLGKTFTEANRTPHSIADVAAAYGRSLERALHRTPGRRNKT